MSRSWKKVYGHVDRNPFMKNQANRRIRQLSIDVAVSDGSDYKKFFCSYDICDFKSIDYTEAQFRKTQDILKKRGVYDRLMKARGLSFEDIVKRDRNKSRSK